MTGMTTIKSIAMAMMIGAGALTLAACEESAEDKAKDAMEDMQDAMEDATE